VSGVRGQKPEGVASSIEHPASSIASVSVATTLEQAWGYFRRRLTRGDVFL